MKGIGPHLCRDFVIINFAFAKLKQFAIFKIISYNKSFKTNMCLKFNFS